MRIRLARMGRAGPAALDTAHRLLVFLDERILDFPSGAPVALGRRVVDANVDLLAALARAHYAPAASPARRPAVDEANAQLALLCLLLRACRDGRNLSHGQRDHAALVLTHSGRILGAWRKRERSAAHETPEVP